MTGDQKAEGMSLDWCIKYCRDAFIHDLRFDEFGFDKSGKTLNSTIYGEVRSYGDSGYGEVRTYGSNDSPEYDVYGADAGDGFDDNGFLRSCPAVPQGNAYNTIGGNKVKLFRCLHRHRGGEAAHHAHTSGFISHIGHTGHAPRFGLCPCGKEHYLIPKFECPDIGPPDTAAVSCNLQVRSHMGITSLAYASVCSTGHLMFGLKRRAARK